jgi:hypothetical protein
MKGAAFMRFLETEPAADKPAEFDKWFAEICELADDEGEAATVGVVLGYAPVECVRFIASQQSMWAALMARARHTDMCRFYSGIYRGRRLSKAGSDVVR